jgi:hypothetical protein
MSVIEISMIAGERRTTSEGAIRRGAYVLIYEAAGEIEFPASTRNICLASPP